MTRPRTTSSGLEGAAASAAAPAVVPENALAQADQWEGEALEAIEQVQTSEEAESLLARVATVAEAMRLSKAAGDRKHRWAGLELKAEHRWGVLLGEAEHGGDRKSDQVTAGDLKTGADRMRVNRARKVAKVPLDKLNDYISTEPEPTRAGVLRLLPKTTPAKAKAEPKAKAKPKAKKLLPEEAFQRLRERVGHLRTLTRASMPKWSNEDMDDAQTLLNLLEKRRKKYAGGRLREVGAIRKKLGRKSIADLQRSILLMTATLESSRIADYDLAHDDAEYVRDLYDDLIQLQFWMDYTLSVARAHMDDAHELEVLRRLREEHRGMTPAERDTALSLADRLEAKRNNRLAAG